MVFFLNLWQNFQNHTSKFMELNIFFIGWPHDLYKVQSINEIMVLIREKKLKGKKRSTILFDGSNYDVIIAECNFNEVEHKIYSGTCAIRHLSFPTKIYSPKLFLLTKVNTEYCIPTSCTIRPISLVLWCVRLDRFHCTRIKKKNILFFSQC